MANVTSTIVTVVSSVLCAFGFLGNVTIATIIVRRKKMQTPTNWFIFNLTICDLVISTTTIPSTLIISDAVTFPFGQIGCEYLVMPVFEHFASVSVLTHTAISFAQYTAISRSVLQRFIRAKFVATTIVIIWLVSFLVLSVTMMGPLGYFELVSSNSTTDVTSELTLNGTVQLHRNLTRSTIENFHCRRGWVSNNHKYAYRIIVFTLTYVLPMLLTGFSYYKIHVVVRDSLNRVNSLLTEAMLRNRSRKLHQMNTALTAMYAAFAFLTLPLQVFYCLREFGFLKNTPIYIIDLFIVLFYSQILSNPFVLLYAGNEYRKELRYVLFCCFSVLPRVQSTITGSFRKLYRQQTTETADVNLEDICSLPSPKTDGDNNIPEWKYRDTGPCETKSTKDNRSTRDSKTRCQFKTSSSTNGRYKMKTTITTITPSHHYEDMDQVTNRIVISVKETQM